MQDILKISSAVGEMVYKLSEANAAELKKNLTEADKQAIESRNQELQKVTKHTRLSKMVADHGNGVSMCFTVNPLYFTCI